MRRKEQIRSKRGRINEERWEMALKKKGGREGEDGGQRNVPASFMSRGEEERRRHKRAS